MQSQTESIVVRLPHLMSKPIVFTDCSQNEQYTEEEMKEVTSDLMDIREITKDTSILITCQGESIDNVERSVELAHDNIEEGAHQLEKAMEEKKKERGTMTPLLIGLGVGTAVAGPIGFLLSTHLFLGIACLAAGGGLGVGGGYLIQTLSGSK